MTIIAIAKSIIGGTGGPNHDSIPLYNDNKAPFGNHPVDPQGHQLMFPNSAISGTYYVTVDPFSITPEENAHNVFVTFKPDGKPNYIRLWIRDPITGNGKEYSPDFPLWAEYSHFAPYTPEPPAPPEATIDGTITAAGVNAEFHVGPDGDWIRRT